MKIFIGCSMNDKIGESFKQTSEKLLKEILVDNDLVFGACDSGIMGIAYNIAIANNKSVTGVCPDKYKDDFKNLNCNHEFTTKDIATRVNTFVEESDVLIFLPGGYGTLCEFFCMVEQKRAGEFDKPIILYNDSKSLYYSTLTGFFSEMKEFGFSTEKEESYFKIMSCPKEVADFLKSLNKELTDNKKEEELLKKDLDSIVFLNRISAVNMTLNNNTPTEVKATLNKSIVFSEVDTMENKRSYNSLIDVVISLEEIIKIELLTRSEILKDVRNSEYSEDTEDIKNSYKMGITYLSLNDEDLKELSLSNKSEYVKKLGIKKDTK